MTRLAICVVVFMLAPIARSALVYDWSTNAQASTEDQSFSHTPQGSATPEVVIVVVAEEVLASQAQDGVAGVTYGGVSLTEVPGSPVFHAGNSIDDSSTVHMFYLRASVPTGSQTVVVDGTLARNRSVVCYTLNSSGSFKFKDIDATLNDVLSNPFVDLSLGGDACWLVIVFGSGQSATSGITPITGWTSTMEFDNGSSTVGSYRKDVIAANDTVAKWTQTLDDAHMIAIAIADSTPTAGGPSNTKRRRVEGVRADLSVGDMTLTRQGNAIFIDRKGKGKR